jgi:hypothetical protein
MNLLNKKHVEMGFIQEPPESSIYGKNFTITLNEKKTGQGKNTITINFKGSVFEIVQSDQNRFFEMFLIAYTGDKKFINLKKRVYGKKNIFNDFYIGLSYCSICF